MTKIQAGKTLLERVYDLAKIGHFEMDVLTNGLYWSDAVKDIHEVEHDFIPTLEDAYDSYPEGKYRSLIKTSVELAIRKGIPYDLELPINTAKGNVKWVRDIGEPEFENGKCVRLVGIVQDITSIKLKEIKFKKYQKFISDLSTNHNLLVQDIDAVLPVILTQTAEILDLERVNIWVLRNEALECISSYHSGLINEDKGTILKNASLPNYFSAIENNRFIIAESPEKHPAYSELVHTYLKENKIKSILDVSVMAYGSVRIVICFESTSKKYKWTNEEITFAGSVGDQIAQLFANDYKKRKEEHLLDSLKEKETLMMEIHHRVKNNLAIVSGLLQLQAYEIENIELRDKLIESVLRIKVMATIHELLYQSNSFTNIDFSQNLNILISSIEKSSQQDENLKINLECEPLTLNVNQAVPCSLIVNEVITNSVKHAFPENTVGIIDIYLENDQGQIVLTITDNGIGLPEDVNLKEGTSLGIRLIHLLTEQLEGNFSFTSNKGGTVFKLHFEKQEVGGSISSYL